MKQRRLLLSFDEWALWLKSQHMQIQLVILREAIRLHKAGDSEFQACMKIFHSTEDFMEVDLKAREECKYVSSADLFEPESWDRNPIN